MKRLRAAAVSLALLAALLLAAVWVRSYFRLDSLFVQHEGSGYLFSVVRGWAGVVDMGARSFAGPKFHGGSYAQAKVARFGRGGSVLEGAVARDETYHLFLFRAGRTGPTKAPAAPSPWFPAPTAAGPRTWVAVPLWLPTVLCLAAAFALARPALRARRRRRAGLCTGCGYDLRASPGRCPECGDEPLAARPAISRGSA